MAALGVPEGHVVCAAITLGFAEGQLPEAAPRKENTIHITR
jgi:hypothetical protein